MEQYFLRGTPREMGWQYGRLLRESFPEQVTAYLEKGMYPCGMRDPGKVQQAIEPFLATLPEHFREEMFAFAEGVNLPIERVAAWYCETLTFCSTIVTFPGGTAWTGHNVDYSAFGSYRWSCATVFESRGRIPFLNLALKGDLHSYQGVNRSRLWIHSNYLPALDQPGSSKRVFSWLFLLREALETCESILEVENLMANYDRDMGIALTVIDGKTNEAVIFECSRTAYRVIQPDNGMLAVTNHFRPGSAAAGVAGEGSIRRLERIYELASNKYPETISDFSRILADPGIEKSGEFEGTIQAVIAAPGLKEIWFAGDNYPAASCGTFRRVNWPWD